MGTTAHLSSVDVQCEIHFATGTTNDVKIADLSTVLSWLDEDPIVYSQPGGETEAYFKVDVDLTVAEEKEKALSCLFRTLTTRRGEGRLFWLPTSHLPVFLPILQTASNISLLIDTSNHFLDFLQNTVTSGNFIGNLGLPPIPAELRENFDKSLF